MQDPWEAEQVQGGKVWSSVCLRPEETQEGWPQEAQIGGAGLGRRAMLGPGAALLSDPVQVPAISISVFHSCPRGLHPHHSFPG